MRIPISPNTSANETEAEISGASLTALGWSHGCIVFSSLSLLMGGETSMDSYQCKAQGEKKTKQPL